MRISPIVVAGALSLRGTCAAQSTQSIPLSSCRLGGVDGVVRCGEYLVPESSNEGRMLSLKVIVLPARAPSPLSDPVMMVSPGGPGTTNSEALVIRGWRSWMRDQRDIVIVDLRGTSGPSRLDCAFADAAGPDSQFLAAAFSPSEVRKCRSELEQRADLRAYSTPLIVEDLEGVRRALGLDRVNLWAASWGTRIVYLWMRVHPDHIRSVILEGTMPSSLLNPLPHARTAQHALDGLFAECLRQAKCRDAYPNIRAEFDELMARVKRQPLLVRVVASRPADSVSVSFAWPEVAEALRTLTYSPPRSTLVPMLIHQLFLGDSHQFVAQAVAMNRAIRSTLRFGFLLSITCTEDVPRIDPRDIPRETERTYLGDTRVRQQIAACDEWPRGTLAPDYAAPVHSALPAFLLSGTVDPVAGSEFTENAAKDLPNSIHVVAPGGHTPAGPCIDAMELAFLQSADPRVVDTSCVATMRLADFVTDHASRP